MPVRKYILFLILLFAFHSLIFTASLFLFCLSPKNYLSYYFISAGCLAAVSCVFALSRRAFRFIPSGETLQKLNIANLLTLFRLTSLPTIAGFLLIARKIARIYIILIPYLAAVFLTDLFDGFIARKLHQQTELGKYLDSSADYLMLIGITGVYLYMQVIPPWFALLVFFRLLLQTGWIIIVYIKRQSLKHKNTFLGKAAVFSIMLLYAFELFELLHFQWIGNSTVVLILEWTAGSVVFASIFDKLFLIKRSEPKKE